MVAVYLLNYQSDERNHNEVNPESATYWLSQPHFLRHNAFAVAMASALNGSLRIQMTASVAITFACNAPG